MNNIAQVFLSINAAFLMMLPRRWAALPLLMGACYMTVGQQIVIGPFHFTVIRILLAVGVARIIARGERLEGPMNELDWLMFLWASWMLINSFFHSDPAAAFVFRLGLAYDACGLYFVIRILCRSFEDVENLFLITAILLFPLAIAMSYEKMTENNLFSMLGGIIETPDVREGKVRAQGPFSHPILAGTVGAVSMPLMIGLLKFHRKAALIGMLACVTIVFTSSSTGPIISALAGVFALFMWCYRSSLKSIRWLMAIGYIALDIVMKDSAYYLIARIDLAGGSTGWYRARLIESAFEHIDEWWLWGTDYTRHWMHVTVSWNADHTDITNHYIQMGIWGGLPLMLLFIATLAIGFSFVGKAQRQGLEFSPQSKFMFWTLGASLFAHTATFISVSYFGQLFVFFYLNLGIIGSMGSLTLQTGYSERLAYKRLAYK